MKRIVVLVLIIILASSIIFTACSKKASIDESEENNTKNLTNEERISIDKTAISFIEDLVNKRYENAYNNYKFDKKMKDAVNPEILKSIMEQLYASYKEFKKIVEIGITESKPYDIVNVTCEFKNGLLNLNVVFDGDKKIAGFNFTEVENIDEDKENNLNIDEKEVVIGKGKWELPGTLTLPKGEGEFPVVVLVHGSGPNDRDESVGPNKPFKDIAQGLASKGIAVLRYEKRTKHYMNEMATISDNITVKEETIDDVLQAVELLRNSENIDIDNIYVLGHSLGGYLIPRIGVEDESIAGFIILAGSTRPLEDLILEQVEYIYSLDDNVTEEEQKEIDTLKSSVKNIKSEDLNESTSSSEILGINAKYWLDLRNYKPTKVIKDIKKPILVLQGKRDYQVTMVDFNNWKEALENNDEAKFISYEKLNHLFIEGKGKVSPNEYYIKGNVSNKVIHDISDWINNLK